MMPTASSTGLYSLGHDNQNEMHHGFIGHVAPLLMLSVSHNAGNAVSGTIAFLRL